MDQVVNEDVCQVCNQESTKGCHGVKEGSIYSEYYCDECFQNRKSLGEKDEVSKAVQKD